MEETRGLEDIKFRSPQISCHQSCHPMLQTMHTIFRLSDLQSDKRASTTSEADLVISLVATHCVRTEQRAELGLSFPLERLALEDWFSKRPTSIELMTCMWWHLKNLNGHNALCFSSQARGP